MSVFSRRRLRSSSRADQHLVSARFVAEGLEARLHLSAVTFQPAVQYKLGESTSVGREVAVGDFNNDGKPDLLETTLFDHVVSLLLNKGGGVFASPRLIPTADAPFAMAVGDFNHDGANDFAVGIGGANNLQVFTGLGNGTFSLPVNYSLGGAIPGSIAVADLNGDGRLDLAMTAYPVGDAVIMLNNGNGTFAPVQEYPIQGSGSSIIIDDFNRDHVWDLAVGGSNTGSTGTLNVLLGNSITDPNDPQATIPDGTFASADHYPIGQTPTQIISSFPDFNGDGFDDLAVANQNSGTVSVLLGDGDGGFGLPNDVVFGSGLTTAAAGNFTQSGHTDLVAAVDSNVQIMLGSGDGNVQLPALSFPIGSTNQGALVVADLNADGKPDIVVSDMTGVIVLLSGTGDTTAPKAALAAPLAGITAPSAKPYTFSIKFTDNKAVNVATLATGAVRVTGPHMYSQLATLVSVDVAGNGTPRTATYRITPLLDSWDASTNGAYTVALVGGKVADTSGNFAAGATLGTFAIHITVGAIGGYAFNDVNANGVSDAGDARLANVRLYIDANKNGVFDSATEKSVLTNGMGSYSFANLAAGTYRIREVPPAGHRISSPSAGFYDVALGAGQILMDKIFANTTHPLLSGTVFSDVNGDKLRDRFLNVLEPGLANWRIYIDANHNGVFDAGETSTLTDASGNWAFKTLTARTAAYIVRVVPQAKWTRTTPTTGTPAGSFSIVLASNGVSKTGLLFGEKHAAL